MEQPKPERVDLSAIAKCLRDQNQRHLDRLKQSGDPADAKSKILATILDSVADGIIVMDENLTIVMANLAAASLAEWDLEDVTREELRRNYKFFRSDGVTPIPPENEPIVLALRDKQPYQSEGYIVSQRDDGRKRWVRTHAAPLFDQDGKPVGGVSVFNDITDRIMLQRQRDCMAALITHDLKNHLAAELLLFDLLLENNSEQFDPETLKMFKEICASSEKFFGIANSMLETFQTRFFTGTETYEAVDTLKLVKEAAGLSELEATSRGVQVSFSCIGESPQVRGLPRVINHIFHNIIQNAIEASPRDSIVSIAVSTDGHRVVVNVTDCGAGMTEEEVSSLFDPLKVATRGASTKRSTGFGLYLSAMLAEGQGGTITCKSTPGQGTNISIKLPLAAVAQK